LAIFAFKRGLLWLMTISYMVLCLGVVIPTLISLVVDLYIILPFRFMIDPHMVPRFRMVDQWALGVVYSNIVLHCYQLQPGNRLSGGLQNVRIFISMHSATLIVAQLIRNGWTRPDPLTASKEIIGPVIGGLLGMTIFPAVVFDGMRRLLPGLCADNKVLCELNIHILMRRNAERCYSPSHPYLLGDLRNRRFCPTHCRVWQVWIHLVTGCQGQGIPRGDAIA
jgi:E3 ubiquitin-protein ligase MARCH6